MKPILGGVCAAKGYKAAGVIAGIKNFSKRDLALIYSEERAACACCYTQNLVKGAPIHVTRQNAADGYARAIICNSGNANTCAEDGIGTAQKICALTAAALGISESDVVIASTGVIGQKLALAPFERGIPELVKALDRDSAPAAEAIMTTDTYKKELAAEFTLGFVTCRIGGMAKGSGMINPNMATMLSFITTDAAVSPEILQKALSADISDTFNMLSVDGDTSTNDMITLLANGFAGNKEITDEDGEDYRVFTEALRYITSGLCRMLAKDGEGATKLIICDVSGAIDTSAARKLAKSVISSPLVKTAMFGADANWGRVLCALGYSGAFADADKIGVTFSSKAGETTVCENGRGIAFSEADAKKILSEDEITISVNMQDGRGAATALGCDLTYDYVKINGDYRT